MSITTAPERAMGRLCAACEIKTVYRFGATGDLQGASARGLPGVRHIDTGADRSIAPTG